MAREFVLKRCNKCGELVKVLKDNCIITCCGEEMQTLTPNSVDAAVEKHVPQYKLEGEKIVVTVNHVMEEEHYIEWIAMVTDEKECIKYLKPGKDAEVKFCYKPGAMLYAYCNKHGLWEAEVK